MTGRRKYKKLKRVQLLMEQEEHDLAAAFSAKTNISLTQLLTDNLFVNLKTKMDKREVEDALKAIIEKRKKENPE